MQSFAEVLRSLLVSIRALETRRAQHPCGAESGDLPTPTLADCLPYRCEPTRWGELGTPSGS